jgi:hypothetical protein
MRPPVLLILCLAAAGCFYPHPPPPPPPPELGAAPANCADAIFPLNPRIGAWSVDKFTGHYWRDRQALTVTRHNQRLLVMRPGFGTREITADNVESRHWHDACGVRYQFTLPPDGSGGWLRITEHGGTTSDWRRGGD